MRVQSLATPNIERKPSSLRYYQEGVPDVDIAAWRLTIQDQGGSPLILSYEDLFKLPQSTQHRRLVCVCNWTIKRYWSGVLLKDALAVAGVNADKLQGLHIKQVSTGTPDKGVYESWIDLAGAVARDAILAHSVDGAPLPPEQGHPLRLVDFGLYAYKNVKGLTRLEVTPNAQLGHWEELAGYPLDGTVKPKRYYSVDLRKHMLAVDKGEVTQW